MVRPKTKSRANPSNFGLAAEYLTLPLHAKVRQVLRERALQDFAHCQQFYSERDLIDKLGVSQPTIRRALSDLVGEGYLVADARRGYFVQHHSEKRYVGLVQPIRHPHPSGNVAADYASACRERDIAFHQYGVHTEDGAADVVRMIRHKPSEERIILCNLTLELTCQLGSLLQAAGYRQVLFGQRPESFTGSSVYRDQDQEVALVLDYLVGLGHRRIVFIANEPEDLLITNRRAQIIERELRRRGLDQACLLDCATRVDQDSFEAAYRKTRDVLQRKPWPTAIVPLSGQGAWAALRCALEHGAAVPGQISIVSFDSLVNSELLPIPMTELTLSLSDCAQKSVELLWSDSPEPVHANIETHLVVRQSSAAARTED